MPDRLPPPHAQPDAVITGDRPPIAYLFERFPAFTQTFCAREVLELSRQGLPVPIYSIRRPTEPPPSDLPLDQLTVHYLPDTNSLPFKLETKILARGHRRHWDPRADRRDKNRFQEALYLGRRLRRRGIAHVHAHFAGLGARTAWWMQRLFGLSYSLTVHAKDIFNPKPDQRLPMETLVHDARFVITVTDHSAGFLRERVPGAEGRILRIYNGLDLTHFHRAQPDRGPLQLLSIGRLIEKKGFIYLLQACGQLRAWGLSFVCRIVGSGPLHDELAGYIQTERLEPYVQLLGARTQAEIVDLLAAASVFVLPAVHDRNHDSDNLPTVIAEAMASALPIVGTRLAGIPEMVIPGRNGFLAEERQPEQLADLIRTLAENPAMRAGFGLESRRLAEERFDLHATVAQLRQTFRQRLG
ncbi:MAG: glycosyltransferase family 4 protein [Verrucomicrobia bacterium]|nr:glycosyltransferase family 4 protein [Verrucomicrobiota bacterium]